MLCEISQRKTHTRRRYLSLIDFFFRRLLREIQI